jgi:hypothetical protein
VLWFVIVDQQKSGCCCNTLNFEGHRSARDFTRVGSAPPTTPNCLWCHLDAADAQLHQLLLLLTWQRGGAVAACLIEVRLNLQAHNMR